MSTTPSSIDMNTLADRLAAKLGEDRERDAYPQRWLWLGVLPVLGQTGFVLQAVFTLVTLYTKLRMPPALGADAQRESAAVVISVATLQILIAAGGFVVATWALRYCKLRYSGVM